MGKINGKQQQDWIVQFQSLEDWQDRYKLIIQMGQALAPLAPQYQTEKYLVKGCQSKVWLVAHFDPPKLYFQADSDALIVKGLIAILLKVYSGQTPSDILSISPHFIEDLGLNTHLSQVRANGLVALIKQMKYDALAFKIQTETPK